ncbi:hypothetical protein [Schlesneria paludicola]|uniref:hypothetical protein n=1 Tax=Schlesneria paludicola TaxID=360056 RepID=UPI00029A41E7|nr:hypothetical protein [Schlesneria paludicola]
MVRKTGSTSIYLSIFKYFKAMMIVQVISIRPAFSASGCAGMRESMISWLEFVFQQNRGSFKTILSILSGMPDAESLRRGGQSIRDVREGGVDIPAN